MPYARWSELHEILRSLVGGRKVAMEISPEDAVPYLDRIPYGVVELLRRLGADVVPSGALVSRFAARWSQSEADDHRAAAEILADVARRSLEQAVRTSDRLSETALQARVMAELQARGLVFDEPPIVAFGPNSAKPHYLPQAGSDAILQRGQVVLLDLWAGRSLTTVFADQTWIGFAGTEVPQRVREVWTAVRGTRAMPRSTLSAARRRAVARSWGTRPTARPGA
jgi:Xaa-Pro dipeptidase